MTRLGMTGGFLPCRHRELARLRALEDFAVIETIQIK